MSFVIDMLISDGILEIDCSANFMDDTLSFTHNNGLISYYDYSGIILNDINKNVLLNIDKLSFNNTNKLASYSKDNINLTTKNNVINIDTSGIIFEEKNISNFINIKGYYINDISDNGFISFDIDFINKIPLNTLPVVVINQESNNDIIPLIITSITKNGFYWKSTATGVNKINYIATIPTLNSDIHSDTISINDASDNGYISFNNNFIIIPIVIISQESEGDIIPLNITSITNNGFYWRSVATGINKINYIANNSNLDLSNPEINDIVIINDSSDNGYIQFNTPLISPIVIINRNLNEDEDIICIIVTSVTSNGFYWKSSATGVKQINYNAYSVIKNSMYFNSKSLKLLNESNNGVIIENINGNGSITLDNNSSINVNGSNGSNGQFLMNGLNSLQWSNPFKTHVINNITTLNGTVLFDAYTFINTPFIMATTVSINGYYVGVSVSSITKEGFNWLLTSLNIIQINFLLIGN